MFFKEAVVFVCRKKKQSLVIAASFGFIEKSLDVFFCIIQVTGVDIFYRNGIILRRLVYAIVNKVLIALVSDPCHRIYGVNQALAWGDFGFGNRT